MCNTELGQFCSTHDNWLEILSADPFNIKIKEDGPYIMFSYDQIHSDFNNKIVQEARGIIFKNGEWETPVCWAFNKFGNYGESYVPEIDWSTAFVTEKIDGSLIKLWYDQGDWRISTNGCIEAFDTSLGDTKYKNFGSYFYTTACDYYDSFPELLHGLDKNLTYMFELVGPCNRVVIPYDHPAIYFLGARNKFTGEEFFCTLENMKKLGVSKFNSPTIFPLTSLNKCIKAADVLGWDQEGFVVADSKFNRVKVKSPSYVLAHYMRNNNVITRKHLIRVILENEVEEFLCYAADYKDCLLECQELMESFLRVGNWYAAIGHELRSRPRKDYAEIVKALPKLFSGVLFCNYDKRVPMQQYTQGWSINKWEEYLTEFEKLRNNFIPYGL